MHSTTIITTIVQKLSLTAAGHSKICHSLPIPDVQAQAFTPHVAVAAVAAANQRKSRVVAAQASKSAELC
jgi:hypothetical protein